MDRRRIIPIALLALGLKCSEPSMLVIVTKAIPVYASACPADAFDCGIGKGENELLHTLEPGETALLLNERYDKSMLMLKIRLRDQREGFVVYDGSVKFKKTAE